MMCPNTCGMFDGLGAGLGDLSVGEQATQAVLNLPLGNKNYTQKPIEFNMGFGAKMLGAGASPAPANDPAVQAANEALKVIYAAQAEAKQAQQEMGAFGYKGQKVIQPMFALSKPLAYGERRVSPVLLTKADLAKYGAPAPSPDLATAQTTPTTGSSYGGGGGSGGGFQPSFTTSEVPKDKLVLAPEPYTPPPEKKGGGFLLLLLAGAAYAATR